MKDFVESNKTYHELKIGEYGFHGDVDIECIETLPDGFESWPIVNDDCLAYGEATGHAHKLFGDFELRENPKTKERVFITKGNIVYLKHQEHQPRGLVGKGKIYRHRIVREYDHFENIIREVAD